MISIVSGPTPSIVSGPTPICHECYVGGARSANQNVGTIKALTDREGCHLIAIDLPLIS